jgi:DNA ligase-1
MVQNVGSLPTRGLLYYVKGVKMTNAIKPMLAGAAPEVFNFPLLASPKLDGIRCMVHNGVAMSRNWKPIPNLHVQKMIGRPEFNGFDGELGVGNPGAPDFYRTTMSAVMSEEGEPDFTYWVFDHISIGMRPFGERVKYLVDLMSQGKILYPANLVEQRMINDQSQLDEYESEALGQGYEGLIVRNPYAAYKHGRSSTKEGGMLKLKRFSDAEAVIIGFQELMKNNNVAERNAFGRTERSSHKENMQPMGTLGAFVCKTPEGVEFAIGTGYTAAMRQEFWDNRKNLIGKLAKYKFFDGGNKEAPRFPVFIGFRDVRDL